MARWKYLQFPFLRLASAPLSVLAFAAAFLSNGCVNAEVAWDYESALSAASTLETTPPVVPVSPITVTNGTLQVLSVSSLPAVTLGGTCPSTGGTIVLTGAITDTMACAGGTWGNFYNLSVLADGYQAVQVAWTPPAGSTESAANLPVTLIKDTQVPTAPGIFNLPSLVFTTQPRFDWTASTDVGSAGMHATSPYSALVYQGASCGGTTVVTRYQTGLTFNAPAGNLVDGQSYSWIVLAMDAAQNGAPSGCSVTTFQVALTPASLSLSEASSNSGYARSPAAQLSITADAGASSWCVSETQPTAPSSASAPCTGGLGPSQGWYTTVPTALTLSGAEGLKSVYLWVADAQGSVKGSGTPSSITLDTVPPAVFTVAGVTNGSDTTADGQLLDISGNTVTVAWAASSGLDHYSLAIKESGADRCSPVVSIAPGATSQTATGCSFTNGATYDAIVTAWDLAGNPRVATLPFTVGGAAVLSLSVSGNTPVTYPSARAFTVTLTNTSATTNAVVSSITSTSARYALTHSCLTTIAPAATCVVSVNHTPQTTGTEAFTIQVNYNNGITGTSVADSGYGVLVNAASITVASGYAAAMLWNDYLKVTSTVEPLYRQSSVIACNGTETAGYKGCFHAGEIRKAQSVSGVNSCAGLSASDTLSALDWVCDSATMPVSFYATGLKKEKRLADLVNAASWKPNTLEVRDSFSNVVMSSTASTWWGNTVSTVAPGYSGNLSGSSVIHVVNANQTTNGLYLLNDRQSLVVLPAYQLTYGGAATGNCDFTSGTSGGPDYAIVCSNRHFLWIEGTFNGVPSAGANATHGLALSGSSFLMLRNVQASGLTADAATLSVTRGLTILRSKFTGSSTGLVVDSPVTPVRLDDVVGGSSAWGFYLTSLHGSHLRELTASNNSSLGMYVENSSGNTYERLKLLNNLTHGAHIYSSTGERIVDSRAFGNANEGIRLEAVTDSIISQFLSADNGSGLSVIGVGSQRNTFHQLTFAHNAGSGLEMGTSGSSVSSNIVGNALLANSQWGMYAGTASSNNVYYNIAAANNSYGIYLDMTSNNNFKGYLRTSSNSIDNCNVVGGVSPGLTDVSCAASGVSTATTSLAFGLTGVFVGAPPTNAATSGATTTPFASLAANLLNLDTEFRTWGKYVASVNVLDASARGRCTSGTCQIWDWGLRTTDTTVLNRSGSLASLTANDTWTDGAPCPSQVNGVLANTITTLATSPVTYLKHAVEAPVSMGGNGNGLCESGEHCVYAPNAGAYLGHGDPTNHTCIYSGTTITGVTMHAFPSNGY